MNTGREERLRLGHRASHALSVATMLILACAPPTPPPKVEDASLVENTPASQHRTGRHGGRLTIALAAEPKTLNPVTVADVSSRTIIDRTTAELVYIDRESQQTVPALAETWDVSPDGRRFTLKLRHGLHFSDGHPADADDVVFSFRVYLDERVASPGRHQLVIGGAIPKVRKIDSHSVEIELPEPYAAAERLFAGFPILPRHRLEESHEMGHMREVWGRATPAGEIVGLGPFRLRQYLPGERLVLERNPFYWKRDAEGRQLPYLDEIVFLLSGSQETQTLRFLAGEIDALDRLDPDDFAALNRAASARGFQLFDLGSGLDYNFLFFNLNELAGKTLPEVARKQRWFRQVSFRQAVLAAIDLNAIARLVYQGRATPLASFVTPGNKLWVDGTLEPPRRSLERARRLLEATGFHWDAKNRLMDSEGHRVEFSILTASTSPLRTSMAAVIQGDLKQLGLNVRLTSLELGAMTNRLLTSFDYEACILGLGGGDTSPNRMLNLLMSSGNLHLWNLGQEQPATPWEAEIDRLMQEQLTTLDVGERKRLYDRVQQIVAQQLPVISLVSPNVLIAAKQGLGNFRPTIHSHQTLWNAEELFWHGMD